MNMHSFPDDWPATLFPDLVNREVTVASHATPTLHAIRETVCMFWGLREVEFLLGSRERRLAWPRQEASWLAREYTLHSFPAIARAFGYADPTSVLHGVKACEKRRRENKRYDIQLSNIRDLL